MKKPILKSPKELRRDFIQTYLNLQSANTAYDQGQAFQASTIAVYIFSLLFDTGNNKPSGLTLQNLTNKVPFITSARKIDPSNLISEFPMCMISSSQQYGLHYKPFLAEDMPLRQDIPCTQSEWMEQAVLETHKHNVITRESLILYFRHETGAHLSREVRTRGNVDAHIFQEIREGLAAGGWTAETGNGEESIPLYGAEYATMRQIGWEVEKSLAPCFHENELRLFTNSRATIKKHILTT